MTTPEHRSMRELLGPFVLDQLDAAQRAAVDEHVAGCPACRADVADLTPAAAKLQAARAVARPGTTPALPPPDLVERIVAATVHGAGGSVAAAPVRHGERRAGFPARVLAVAAAVAVAFGLG